MVRMLDMKERLGGRYPALRAGMEAVGEMAIDDRGTAIMAYAFLSGLIAVAAAVSFQATGDSVGALYDMIATVFVASMP